MKSRAITPLLLGLLAQTSCGGGGGSSANPPALWLAPDQAETRVKLVDQEPDPF